MAFIRPLFVLGTHKHYFLFQVFKITLRAFFKQKQQKQIKQRIRHMHHYIIDRPKSNGVKTYASSSQSSTADSFSCMRSKILCVPIKKTGLILEVRIADCAIKRKIWKQISDGFQ